MLHRADAKLVAPIRGATLIPPVKWHLKQLDALRGIAVLGTVAVHSVFTFPISGRLYNPMFAGQRGVQLFFLVSWFTLFMSDEHRREENHPTRNFFLRRIFRIGPLYYVVLLAVILLGPKLSGFQVLMSSFFLHGLTPWTVTKGVAGGWTLTCEVFSYLCLPLLFPRVRTLRRAIVLFVISLAACGGLSWLLAHHFPQQADFVLFLFFPAEFPIFALGAVCYFLWKESREMDREKRRLLSGILLVAALLLFFACLPFNDEKLYGTSMIPAMLLMALVLYPWRALVNRVTIFLGKTSYSIYLIHAYVLNLLVLPILNMAVAHHLLSGRAGWMTLERLAGMLFFSIPLATLTWLYIEKPGISAGRKLISSLEPNRSPVVKMASSNFR